MKICGLLKVITQPADGMGLSAPGPRRTGAGVWRRARAEPHAHEIDAPGSCLWYAGGKAANPAIVKS